MRFGNEARHQLRQPHFPQRRQHAEWDVGGETLFHYRQQGDLVWASYEGGGVTLGHLIATVAPDGALDRRYRHRSPTRALMTGICRSRLAILPDGRYRLHEEWRWTSGDKRRGISIVEEIDRAHAEAVADDCRGPAIRPEQ